MFLQAIINILETSNKIGRLAKEAEDMKKNQVEIMELKNAITEIKISVSGLRQNRGAGLVSETWKTEQQKFPNPNRDKMG